MQLTRISSKFNILSIFLILLTALGTGGFVIWHHQKDTLKTFEQHGKELAEMLAKNIEYGVYTENQQVLKQVTQGLQQTNDIAYIVVFNKEVNILFQHRYKIGLRAPLLGKPNTIGLSNTPQLSSYIDPDNNKKYLDIIVPVFIQADTSSVYDSEAEAEAESEIISLDDAKNKIDLIGFLQIGLSEQAIYQRSQQFILEVISVSIVIVLIGVFLTLWLTRRITSPIKSLVMATQSISKGEFSGSIKVISKDEMGILAKSFNQMAKELEKYQSEIMSQQETLEQLVLERTQKLQIAIDHANELTKKAEMANKAKSQFLSNMSHELRTPLNAVLGFSELMLLDEQKAAQHLHDDSINKINIAGKHLLSLVDDILDISKIEAGKIEIEAVEFETAQLLKEVSTLFSHDMKNKGLKFETLYSNEIPLFVKGDFKRIKQVLINLISNAIKFTEEGRILFQLSCTQTDNNQSLFLFKVTDTGIGITEQQQTIIFDSFSQADISTTRTYGGTGLGLSIVKQLVELMGGKIYLTSHIGQGSTFWFTIPLELVSQTQLSTEHEQSNSNQFSANILVAEDFQANQMLIARFLEQYGCSVTVVSNGQFAVNDFKNNRYDLIFMDCQMPELDGYEATRLIRQYELSNAKKCHIPIIALTAHALKENDEKCLYAGMDAIITKPFCRQDLHNSLEKWLPTHCLLNKDVDLQVPFSNNKQPQTTYDLNEIEAIDISFLQKNFDFSNPADQKFIEKLTIIFQQNGKNTLDLLQQAISQCNYAEIKGYAHDLKSICANVGALKLTEQCNMMELLDTKNNISQAFDLFNKMRHAFSLVIKDLVYINSSTD